MITELCAEATEYGAQALRAFEAAGGDALVQRAEADPAARAALTDGVLAELGAWELEPRGDADSLEAAAALCRSAGYWALPYPVAERLSRPADAAADATRRLRIQRLMGTDETKGVRGDLARARH